MPLTTARSSDDAVDQDTRAHVTATLEAVARKHGVRILYAAESGSRAWGFGSPDSDYDVRFIYAHPARWYLSLNEGRDVIERPLDDRLVDLAGWDVRKALRLLLKSNPALYEWFVSPVVYVDDGVFRLAAKTLFEAHASPPALAAHYWSIARGQWAREIDGRGAVKLKKYFYVVRPLLSLMAVVEQRRPPPMDIADLLAAVPLAEPVHSAVVELLAVKRNTPELGLAPRIAVLDAWAAEAIERFAPERLGLPSEPASDAARQSAERLYRATIGLGELDVL